MFKCKKCEEKDPQSEGAQAMNYKKYCEHVSALCPLTFIKCPFECGQVFTQDQLEAHITECPNGFRECDKCGMDVQIKELKNGQHDCIQSLKKIVQDKN